MALLIAIFLLVALVGHWSLCVGAFNRAAASRFPCAVVGLLEKTANLAGVAIPGAFIAWLYICEIHSLSEFLQWLDGRAWLLYMTVCVVAAIKLVPRWLKGRWRKPVPQLVTNDTIYHDVTKSLGYAPID